MSQNKPTIQTSPTIDWNSIFGASKFTTATTRKIELAAKFAYEACAAKQPGGAIGWDQEPQEIKLGWYHAAKLWADAFEKIFNEKLTDLIKAPPFSATTDQTVDAPKNKKYKGKTRAKQRP